MSQSHQPEMLSGGAMLIRALRDEGVEYVYGYPGGAVLHIYDALFQQNDVKHVLVRHEQAATHMADAYARASGKAGVVLVTSGPGATNAVTGIATAYMDSIPMVVICGQVMSHLIGDDAFQETDMLGISRPIVKHNMSVRRPEDIPYLVKKAFYIAQSGRPGPVVLDIPKDMTMPNQKFAYDYPKEMKLRSYNPNAKGHPGQIKKALATLLAAKKPILYAGGGAILGRAADELTELAKRLNLPVTNTLMGLGAFPATDPQFVGMLGMHGSFEANQTMHNADVIFAVGARFDDRVTNATKKFCPNATIIHIDIDPASISKTITAHVPIVGLVKPVLQEMLSQLDKLAAKNEGHLDANALAAWWAQINAWRDVHGGRYGERSDVLKPQAVIEAVWRHTQGDAYVTSDVGQHQMFACRYAKFNSSKSNITSGGLGTMGFALPAAIGAKMGKPEREVVAIIGDGGFQMTIQELGTIFQTQVPVKIVILNNEFLGMVRQWQELFFDNRYASTKMINPNFVAIAEGYHIKSKKVTQREDLDEAVAEMLASKDSYFLEVMVEKENNVFPMIPTGACVSEIRLS